MYQQYVPRRILNFRIEKIKIELIVNQYKISELPELVGASPNVVSLLKGKTVPPTEELFVIVRVLEEQQNKRV
jgi:hypothetical protein